MKSATPARTDVLVGHVVGDPNDLPAGLTYHPGREPNAPAQVNRQPEVLDDPKAIEEAKQLYERALDQRYANALSQVMAGSWVDSRDAFEVRREKALTDLQAIFRDSGELPEARTEAAEELIRLESPTGEAFLSSACGPNPQICAWPP